MKNFLKIIAVVLIFVSCTQNTETPKERMIGFHPNPDLSDLQWHLGTQEAIDQVIALDKVWSARDHEAMREFFVDTVKVTDPSGKTTSNFDEFKNMLEQENPSVNWEFMYAYSVDIDPSQGGEHVQAGFKVNEPDDEDNIKEYYIHESYYIIAGKIVTLSQFKQGIIQE
jgi:hypothetical protein